MERALFARRFREASALARDFAREFIEEPLADAMRFRVRLNASHDGHRLHEEFRLFPGDSAPEVARRLACSTADEAVDALFREGLVPQWIDVAVIGELGSETLLELLCCGRFTGNESRLYHQPEGRAPFHVCGPGLPVDHEDGNKFSIYHRANCWLREEVDRAACHAEKVWSLDLHGDDFDDATIASLPVFPRMHILELRDAKLTGEGLGGVSMQPQLRHLRLYLNREGSFDAAQLRTARSLETLTIDNLPAGAWGFPAIAAHATLDTIDLSSAHVLVLAARLGPRAFGSVTLRAPSIEGDPLPEKVARLSLHLRDASDAEVGRLLARVREVTHLSLRGTPVTNDLVESLASRWRLEYLDVVDTRVDDDGVRRLRDRHAKLRIHPTRPAEAESG